MPRLDHGETASLFQQYEQSRGIKIPDVIKSRCPTLKIGLLCKFVCLCILGMMVRCVSILGMSFSAFVFNVSSPFS
jgi:hypothetical protein